ncbi:ubiquitin carboxyl-terminal hydrolase 15-like isoform X1 [Daphnia pulex]|uniref:ubiquitin carboxyl-terminal hydrolase 15-like isoform X1 n=2 Tax=Daphnia pulex TaxID=6669 RepID=UPI001EE04275|nr:ubiquitin carboxyl-terminal hydrolase 15-like isoform X1 [Daphnia pulex]
MLHMVPKNMAEGTTASGMSETTSECSQVKDLMDQPLSDGDTWYLIDLHWFNLWKKYAGWDKWDSSNVGDLTSHPGNIDNSILMKENSKELKEHLTEDIDFALVPEPVWKLLFQWYQLAPGQEPIARKVVDHGMLTSYLRVEIYLTELKLAKYPEVEKTHLQKFSKRDTLENVEKVLREVFQIPENTNIHLWTKSSNQTYEELPMKKQSIQELSLMSNQTLVAEVQNEDGSWPRKSSYSKRSTAVVAYSSNRYSDGDSSSSRSVQPGRCGLNNLGNTCFMNSVLQCMSNTPPIQRYFLEERHWAELNKENPLGNQGEIAKAFADLLKAMWSGQHHSFPPRAFKLQVGRFAPQFSGYQQHDSQELLTFLLDGLHEDLNRILKKPYIELKDADGRSDEEVAREGWENYRKRNDSVIVDLFHGLLKSTLVCPECNKVSVTFDPTCYLSLPMPVKKERPVELYLARLDPEVKAMRYRVIVPKMGTILDLTEALSKLCGIPADHMIVADVHQHKFHQIFTNESSISQISERDVIYAYELPEKLGTPGTCCLSVYLKEVKTRNNYGYGSMFGVPFILQVPREGMDYDKLYRLIITRMKRYLKTIDEDPAAPTSADAVTNVPSSIPNSCESEMDTEEADLSLENGNEAHPMETNGIEPVANQSQPKRFFTMDLVNLSGNTSLGKLKQNGKPISLAAKNFLTCEWEPAVKEASYDAESAEDYNEDASSQQRVNVKKQVLQLKECLEVFTSIERLGADDAWYCPSCKKHVRATKKFDLWSLPEVLVIHLKRFSYTRSLRDKLDTLVEFPTRGLNMAPYIIDPNPTDAVYDLIGVCNHYGGLGGGHYTAYAKNKDDGSWYYFDDSSVSESSEDSVCSKAAYVLFYIRRNQNSRWIENVRPPLTKSSPAPVHKTHAKRNSANDSEEEMELS